MSENLLGDTADDAEPEEESTRRFDAELSTMNKVIKLINQLGDDARTYVVSRLKKAGTPNA